MKILELGNESIAIQSGAFSKALTLIIEDMRASGIRKVEELGKFTVRIDQCIYEHTGILSTVRIAANYNNCFVVIPSLTRGNALNSASFNKYLSENFDAARLSFYNLEQKGWIDPANSRVGGAFSKIEFKIYLGDEDMISKRYTAEESASVIIHECGHAYTFLQFMADTIVVNAVLQRSYEQLTAGTADKKIKLILTNAAKDMRIDNTEWLQEVTDDTDAGVAYRLLVSAVQIEPRFMDNKRYFTQDASEELADIFAVQHGAGRALLTMRAEGKYGKVNNTVLYMQTVAVSLAVLAAPVICGPVAIPMAIMGLFLCAAAVYGEVKFAATCPDITTFKQTATKIRNQFVDNLKSGKLPKEDVAAMIDNITLADKLIQNYSGDFDPGTMSRFFDMFRRGKMDARSSRAYTDKLEVLVANELFVRAAQFSNR